MPKQLKAVLSEEEHGKLEASEQEFYTKNDKGNYVANVEGVEDVTGLKSALGSEREQNKTNKNQIRDLEGKLKTWEGYDPEEVKAAVEQSRALKDKKLISEGKIDELVAQRTERAVADFESQKKAFNAELEKVTGERDSFKNKLHSVLIDNKISEVATKPEIGVLPQALPDVTVRVRKIFKVNEEGKLEPRDSEGNLIFGKTPNEPLTLEECLTSLRGEAAHLFQASEGGGAGGIKGGMPLSKKKRSEMNDDEKAKFLHEHGQEAYLALPD
jgi:hypothetical protein